MALELLIHLIDMSRENEVIKAIQYLWDEGFLEPCTKNGEPAVRLVTEIREARKAIRKIIKESGKD
jgi:hypothetical protein